MLKRIEEWGRPRFKPMAMLAQMMAASAESCYDGIMMSREGLLQNRPELSGTRERWLECYRHPRKVQGVLLQFVFDPEQMAEAEDTRIEWARMRRKIKKELKNLKPTEREIRIGQRYFRFLYRSHLRELEAVLTGEYQVPSNIREWFNQPELVFFLGVAAPCWLETGKWPAEFLGKAWQGEFESLETLLRFDSSITCEPRISERLFELQRTNPAQYRLLLDAAVKGRTRKLDRADIKFSLAGLLYKWSHEMEEILKGELLVSMVFRYARPHQQAEVNRWIRAYRKKQSRKNYKCALTSPAIRRLYDAVAHDLGRGEIDTDLPQGDEAFRKRVNRNLKLWASLGNWDKIRAA